VFLVDDRRAFAQFAQVADDRFGLASGAAPTARLGRTLGEQLAFGKHRERGRIDGYGTLQWRAAGSALTPVSPLGAYEMQFKTVGPALHAALRTLEGPLQLEGKGAWSNGEAPSFLGTARVPAQLDEQLSPLFRLIALERGAGTFELRLR
jgi:hypothetical protein